MWSGVRRYAAATSSFRMANSRKAEGGRDRRLDYHVHGGMSPCDAAVRALSDPIRLSVNPDKSP
jgi:hypothetical protein